MTPETTTEDQVKCPLCGYTYTAAESQSACRSCPFHRKCRMLRCPNCGYETPAKR